MYLSILFILLIIFGIGLPMVLIISPRTNLFIKLGLSFPIGIGIFTLLMFGTNLLGLKFTLLNEFILLVLVAVPLVLSQLRKIKSLFTKVITGIKSVKFDLAEKILLGVTLFLIITSFINTFYWPVHMWDSVVLYDFRGQVFASTGFMKDAFINGYYYGYPLLTSLVHTIVYLCGGHYPQFIYSIFYLSLGVTFCGLMKELVSRKLSLIATLLLLMTGPLFYHSLYSYTNLTYTVYLSLGVILIYLWLRKMETGYLLLSAILLGLSTWVRSSEPFWLVILVTLFVILIFLKKLKYVLFYVPIVFVVRQSWSSYQSVLAGGGISIITDAVNYKGLLSTLLTPRLWWQVMGYLYNHVVVPFGAMSILFVLSSIVILTNKNTRKNNWLIIFLTYILLASLVLGTFGLSLIVDFWYRIGDAVQRLSMLFYPLFIYSIALVLQKFDRIKE